MGFLGDDEYRKLSENFGIHLCTSQMEGFGHYINESRQSSALILTLDAPPMNELITADCGILIPTTSSSPHNSGERYLATEDDIASSVDAALSLSISDRIELGENARKKFHEDRDYFIYRLNNAL